MKQLFNKFTTLLLFLLATTFAYFGITVLFNSFLINLCLIIIAIFILIQACANVDKNYHLGKYSDDNDDVETNQNNNM